MSVDIDLAMSSPETVDQLANSGEVVLVADGGCLGQHPLRSGWVGGQEIAGVVAQTAGDPQR